MKLLLSFIFILSHVDGFTLPPLPSYKFYDFVCVSERALSNIRWKSRNVTVVEHESVKNKNDCWVICKNKDFFLLRGNDCLCVSLNNMDLQTSFGVRVSHMREASNYTEKEFHCSNQDYLLSCRVDYYDADLLNNTVIPPAPSNIHIWNNCEKLKSHLQENWRIDSGLTYDENFFPKCVKGSDIASLEDFTSVDTSEDPYIANKILECEDQGHSYTVTHQNQTLCGEMTSAKPVYTVEDQCDRCSMSYSGHELDECGGATNGDFLSVYCSSFQTRLLDDTEISCSKMSVTLHTDTFLQNSFGLNYFGCFHVEADIQKTEVVLDSSETCFKYCYQNLISFDPQMIILMKPTATGQISCICQDYSIQKWVPSIRNISNGCEENWCPPIPGPCGSNSQVITAGYSLYCQYTGSINVCFDVLSNPKTFYPDAPPNFDALETPTTVSHSASLDPESGCQSCVLTEDDRGFFWEPVCAGETIRKEGFCGAGNVGEAIWTCDNNTFTFRPEQPDRTNCTADWLDEVEQMTSEGEDPILIMNKILENMENENITSGTLLRLIKVGMELGEKDNTIWMIDINNTSNQTIVQSYLQVTSSLFNQRLAWREMTIDVQTFNIFQLILSNERVVYRTLESGMSNGNVYLNSSDIEEFYSSVDVDDIGSCLPHWIKVDTDYIDYIDGENIRTFGAIYRRELLPDNFNIRVDPSIFDSDANLSIYSHEAIVAFGINEEPMNFTDYIVEIQFNHTIEGIGCNGCVRKCVSWDFDNLQFTKRGCQIKSIESDMTVCECNHLTNFALIFDISNSMEGMSQTEIDILSYMSVSLCSLSCGFSLLTFIILSVSRLPGSPRVSIVKNRSLCLFGLYLLFLVGFDKTQYPEDIQDVFCSFFAISLHFFGLATFTWTLLEGIQLNKSLEANMLTDIDYRRYTMLLRYLWGYGIPTVIITLTLAITYISGQGESAYNNLGKYCWLRGEDFIWAFAGPAAIVILYNIYVFFKTVRVATKARQRHKNSVAGKIMSQMRSWVTLSFLLGMTWILGFFIQEGTEWLAYFFVLLNGSSGIFIFIHSVINNQIVMTELKIRLGFGDKNEKLAINKGGRLAAVKSIKRYDRPKVRKRSPRPRVQTESSSSIPSTTSEEDKRPMRSVRPSPRRSPRRIPRKVVIKDEGYFTVGQMTSDPQTPDNTSLSNSSSVDDTPSVRLRVLSALNDEHMKAVGDLTNLSNKKYSVNCPTVKKFSQGTDNPAYLQNEFDNEKSVNSINTVQLAPNAWKEGRPITLKQQVSMGIQNEHVRSLQSTLKTRHSF